MPSKVMSPNPHKREHNIKENAQIQRNGSVLLQTLLYTPWERRKQTAAVALWLYSIIASASLTLTLVLFVKWTWPVVLVYAVWYAYDIRRPFNGTQHSLCFLRFPAFWRHFRLFFPVQLLREAELPPSTPYMFGYHPHGIFSFGALTNFALEKTAFQDLFPGLNVKLLTVDTNFYIPFWRELLTAAGLAGVGRASVNALLGRHYSVAIVMGGGREALLARPGTADLIIRRRRGFFRIALERGVPVVPVWGFGENDLYEQHRPGTLLSFLQQRLLRIAGFTLPFFRGRGLFSYDSGLIPQRLRIVVVVGRPINPGPPRPSPSPADISALQDRYIAELERLYTAHAPSFNPANQKSPLRVVQ